MLRFSTVNCDTYVSERAEYGTHSIRWKKVTQIYKKIGNLWADQFLLGHTKIGRTPAISGSS